MARLYETGLHPFLWQDGMRQDCIHFYGKIVWDRTASIFMTRWHETGLHWFLWQDCMRQDCVHFYDKMAWDRTAFIFITSQHKTGTHPFYIGMYIHIYTHIYVHIFTSQKECLQIFSPPPPKKERFGHFRKLRKTSSCIDASFKGETHLIVSVDLLGT